MNNNNREKIIVAVAALLFFAAFGTIALMDRTHGTNGEGIGANDVKVDITKNTGHLSIPLVPSDLLVLGAGTDTKIDFKVQNNDRDNDIDTIKVSIPGGEVIGGSSEWYQPAFTHEWLFNATASDEATFTAQDDKFGRVFGGSAQYDVIGNEDDALDHFSVNETILQEVSEAVTVTVEFTAPSTTGILWGNDGMQVEVGDLQTEGSGDTMTPFYPDGYTYMVVENGYTFIIITVSSDQVILEVQYGTKTLFSSTRGSNYEYESEGISYNTGDSKTVAVLEAPSMDDTVIKPIIKTKEGATVQSVDLKMQWIRVEDITATGSNLFTVVKDNSSTIMLPTEPGVVLVDTDGDWIYDNVDTDDDNDGIPDDRDPERLIPGTTWINVNPTISNVIGPEENKVKKGDPFTLTVEAEDTDSDPLDFVWTVEGSEWTATGSSVSGPIDLTKGDHIFTITVSDDKGGESTSTITIQVIEDKKETDNFLVYVIVGVILVLIIAVVIFFILRPKGVEEEEIPEEMPPQEPVGVYEEPQPQTEERAYIDESVMDEEAYEGSVVEPPLPIEEELEVEAGAPTYGTVPVVEDDLSGETPTLPGETEPQEVLDLEQLIDEMERTEEEIGDLCPECSSPLGPYDSECPSCGAQFELALECPNCGAVVEENVPDCPNCGVSFL